MDSNSNLEDILMSNDFVGIVEDNNDPDKKQRVKVRIPYLHGDANAIPTNHLPWSQPKRDNNGLSFMVPDKGKIINVSFPSGNLYFPVYHNAQHLNINLQKKIESYSGADYAAFIAILYNHNTQIFVENEKGLNIIHKFNGINIRSDFMALNLKDNQSSLFLGDDKATQELMLGTNYMQWMDTLIQTLANPYIGNAGAPVIPNPAMINVINQYFALRQTFLSQHIYAIDNNQIRSKEFDVEAQIGDNIKQTNKPKDVNIVKLPIDYTPKPMNETKGLSELNEYTAPPTDGQADTTNMPDRANTQPTEANEKVDKMVRYLQGQGYVVYEDPYRLNIVGIRNKLKDEGKVTNLFDDKCWAFYKDDKNQWVLIDDYKITTTPGYEPRTVQLPAGPSNSGVAMLVYGQFIDKWKIGYHQNRTGKLGGKLDKSGKIAPEHKALVQAVTSQVRNDPSGTGYVKPGQKSPSTAPIGINIHHANNSGIATTVYNWSEGCIVFASKNQHDEFIKLCEQQVSKTNKGRFTFTLIPQKEFDNFA